MIAYSFEVAICTFSVVISDASEAISKYMRPKFIYLPKNKDEVRVKAGEFEAKFAMKQAFGCIDRTHIPIKCPSKTRKTTLATKSFTI